MVVPAQTLRNDVLYNALWQVIGNTYGGTSITAFKVPSIAGSPVFIIKL